MQQSGEFKVSRINDLLKLKSQLQSFGFIYFVIYTFWDGLGRDDLGYNWLFNDELHLLEKKSFSNESVDCQIKKTQEIYFLLFCDTFWSVRSFIIM